MREFFKAIKSVDPDKECFSVTLLEGEGAGEKAVMSGGAPFYLSRPEGFIKAHLKELSDALPGCGSIDGSGYYKELIGHRKDMVICGCGHVSIPIIKLAKTVGFNVIAIDDRSEFVKNALKAGADQGIEDSFENALKGIKGNSFTYFVIVTRGHSYDEECLKEISSKPHAYIGAMGSKRRIAIVKENLINAGVDRQVIESLHSPIGLDIGSETPEEIAVSVLAEIISVKNKIRDSAFPKDIMTEILGTEHQSPYEGRMVLATIIRKSGSAPREVGTKILVTDQGKAVNTIGGGLMEAQVIKTAREILEKGAGALKVIRVGLDNDAASKEGEVCGGELDILLEMISQG